MSKVKVCIAEMCTKEMDFFQGFFIVSHTVDRKWIKQLSFMLSFRIYKFISVV